MLQGVETVTLKLVVGTITRCPPCFWGFAYKTTMALWNAALS